MFSLNLEKTMNGLVYKCPSVEKIARDWRDVGVSVTVMGMY